MNRLFHVTRTPGLAEGVQFSFIEELREALKATTETEVQIKISGDGAKVSKMCHFTTLSFTIMCSEEKHVHPLAIIKALESYEMLEISCKGVFDEINSVIESGKIRPTVNEKEVSVKIFLSADYKFLLLLMGLSGATASHACFWCIMHKNDRHDMSKPADFYNSGAMSRSLEDLFRWVSHKTYGCKEKPLLNIELSHVVVDELCGFIDQ